MRFGQVIVRAVVAFAIFVVLWLLIGLVQGDGLSSSEIWTALLTGALFAVILSVALHFYAKRKARS